MSVKLLMEYRLEFLGLKGGCTGLSESTLVKMPHCWKSHVMAQMSIFLSFNQLLIWIGRMIISPNVMMIADFIKTCEKILI